MILFSVKDISKLNVYIYTLFTPNTLTHGKQTEKTLPQSPLLHQLRGKLKLSPELVLGSFTARKPAV